MVGFEDLDPETHAFGVELVQLIREEIRAAPKDIHLVLASLGTLSASLSFEGQGRQDALGLLLMLLCHRYPKVSKLV